MAKKRRKPPKPAVWLAVFRGVWTVDPRTGNLVSRNAAVMCFTVASGKEEALLTMHNGLLQYDDIEDPGRASSIRHQKLSSDEVPHGVGALVRCSARFIIPRHRMDEAGITALVRHLVGQGA